MPCNWTGGSDFSGCLAEPTWAALLPPDCGFDRIFRVLRLPLRRIYRGYSSEQTVFLDLISSGGAVGKRK